MEQFVIRAYDGKGMPGRRMEVRPPPIYFPFLYSLGVIPFILVKKRVNEAVSEKCRRMAISAMGSEVCSSR